MNGETTYRACGMTGTRVVLVNVGFFLGGIEVLELDLARHLQKTHVDVVLLSATDIPDSLNTNDIHVMHYRDLLSLVSDPMPLVSDSTRKIILASFHPISAMASLLIARKLASICHVEVALFHWVSHSRAFFMSNNFLSRLAMKLAFFSLPRESCYFMNNAARERHSLQWRKDLSEYPVVRIIGRESSVAPPAEGNDKTLRIVSVGRLVPFKGYNRYAPKIVRTLIHKGFDVTWDIWGYGPDRDIIVEAIERHGVADRVKLKGELPRDRFYESIVRYDLFVGMGTALLEAAKAGLPSIVALENGGDLGYGMLMSAPSDSVGDLVRGYPAEKIEKTIEKFLGTSLQERREIRERCRKAALARESTVDEFARRVLLSQKYNSGGIVQRFKESVMFLYLAVYEIKRRMRHL